MDQIESEALYDERGNVSWARPLLQGDMFDGIVLPGFGDQPMKIQIINHPCAMRMGANLTPRITVAPVEPYPAVIGQRGWDGNLRVMPLPELIDEEHFATKLIDITAAPSELLIRARRIATLSHQGIYILQQRLIKHYTRVEMPLELLRRESAAVLTEGVLQWDWVEDVLTEEEQVDESAIEAEAKMFDTWLGEGDPPRRQLLRDEIHHTDIRKQAQRAARDRSRDREDPK
jgi:hypothetical protein